MHFSRATGPPGSPKELIGSFILIITRNYLNVGQFGGFSEMIEGKAQLIYYQSGRLLSWQRDGARIIAPVVPTEMVSPRGSK
jgi:hypothetical protein